MAIPQRVALAAGRPRLGHPLAGPAEGRFQDRGQRSGRQIVGQAQKQAGHELRQAQPLHPSILP